MHTQYAILHATSRAQREDNNIICTVYLNKIVPEHTIPSKTFGIERLSNLHCLTLLRTI